MKRQAQPIQYTVRGVSPELDRALRRKAVQRKQSLNQIILDELTLANVGPKARADFSDLVGRWTSDAAFDEILAGQRQIDADKWK
jgi:hypothetical protein